MNLAKHKDFDSYYEALLPAEKTIWGRLREMLMTNFPELKEKFGYGVPYYRRFCRICFLYPASFPCSGIESGAAFGFMKGYLLSNEQGLLDMGTRKEVAYINILSVKDIRENLLLEIMYEAILPDAELAGKNRK